jgi:hypothetical protein
LTNKKQKKAGNKKMLGFAEFGNNGADSLGFNLDGLWDLEGLGIWRD